MRDRLGMVGMRCECFHLDERADARTRTGDPFITSDEPMSTPVRSSHLRPLSIPLPPDWSGLEVTGADNLVDGWWTSGTLSW